MAALIEIPQGNDIYFEVKYPFPLSSLEDYHVYVYGLSVRKFLLMTFMKTPTGTDKQANVVSTPLGKVGCVIPRDYTATLKAPVIIHIEVRSRMPGSSMYLNSKINLGAGGYDLCIVTPSASPTAMP